MHLCHKTMLGADIINIQELRFFAYSDPIIFKINRISYQDFNSALEYLIHNNYIEINKAQRYVLTEHGLHYFENQFEFRKQTFYKSVILPIIVSIAINTPNWWPWLIKLVTKR